MCGQTTMNPLDSWVDRAPPLDEAWLVFDADLRVLDANDVACALYDYPRSELIGLSLGQLRADCCEGESWNLGPDGRCSFESVHRRRDGSLFSVELRVRGFRSEGRELVSVLVRNLGADQSVEERQAFLKNLYLALRRANGCYIRARTQEELFQTICQIIVDHGGFALARIGVIAEGSVVLKTVAWAGAAGRFNDQIRISIDPASPLSQGPTGQAIRRGRPVVVPNLVSQSLPPEWAEALNAEKLTGCVAVPLRRGGQVIGAISIWGDRGFQFSPEMVDLLSSVGDDLSHALDRLDDTVALEVVSQHLETTRSRLMGVIEGSSDLISAWDSDDRLILANSAFTHHLERVLGVPVKLGETLAESLKSHPNAELLAQFRRRVDEGETFRSLYPQPTSRGTLWWDSSYSPLKDPGGQVRGGLQIAREITDSIRTSEQLRLVQEVLENTPLALMIIDRDGRVALSNRRLAAIVGGPSGGVEGRKWEDLLKDFLTPEGQPPRITACNDEVQRQLVWKPGPGGKPQWYEVLNLSVDCGPESPAQTSVFLLEVTSQVAAEDELAFLRDHDRTTGLPNRLVAERLLRVMMGGDDGSPSPRSVAVLLVNLDRFEFVNDVIGMTQGDAILKELGQRLKAAVPRGAQVARFEGDEFIVLVPEMPLGRSLDALAKLLLKEVRRPFVLGAQPLKWSASMGIAVFPDHGTAVYQLVGRAREALKEAKAGGRNSFRVFEARGHQMPPNYVQLRVDLETALERDELFLEFQPQWNLGDRRLVGLEVLVRWRHPTLGVLSPGSFISIAEDCGLIVPLGHWILEQACRHGAQWRAQGLSPPVVAVNVSAVQFQQRDFFDVVARTLATTEFPGAFLELELTESILVTDTEQTLETIRRLKTLGVRLSIDDFGTGYSSMSYLQRLSVDKLKIDQAFVRDLTDRGESRTIVKAIIDMALGLGLRTIAEGVETESVAAVLEDLGCHEIQGFLLGRPLDRDGIEGILRSSPGQRLTVKS